ncbi:MAG TPA: TolC family protein [Variovorax sp.]|nr:TolC family protein [Variovorax sp.]
MTLRYRQDVPGRAEPAQNSIGIGLRLPFGTDDRYQQLLAAALSELDVARAQEERLQSRLLADLAEARAALQAADQQLSAERTRAGLLRERAELIAKSFRAGETPLPDLLRALAAAAQADAAIARQRTSVGLSRARLHQALGLLP